MAEQNFSTFDLPDLSRDPAIETLLREAPLFIPLEDTQSLQTELNLITDTPEEFKLNSSATLTPGRKKHELTYLLESFKRNKKPLKKEYLRCKIIRAHKKTIRQILQKRNPKTILFKTSEVLSSNYYLNRLQELVYENPSLFKHISPTESGPNSDGKNRRKVSSSFQSFNEEFCQQYFKNFEVRQSYYYFIELVFYIEDADKFCEKFQSDCCENKGEKVHSYKCSEIWRNLKKYVQFEMISELGLDPILI